MTSVVNELRREHGVLVTVRVNQHQREKKVFKVTQMHSEFNT